MAQKDSVLITGCSDGGIGSALATIFAQHGFLVFATARNVNKMSKLADVPDVKLLALDVTNSTQIQAVLDLVRKDTGSSLTHLINNAGRNYYMPLLDEDIDAARKIFDVHVWGPLAVSKAFIPLLKKAKGSVVFITSVAGHLNEPWHGTYAASKAAEEVMADTLRLELAPFHIKVLSVVNGATETMAQSYFEDWKLPDGSLYASIESKIREKAQGNDGAPRSDPMQHAKQLVGEITRGKSGKLWCGASAGTVKFATSYLPTSIVEAGLVKVSALPELTKQTL